MENITRQEHEEYSQEILKKAKSSVKLIAMDQDGTVKGGNDEKYKKANVSELLIKIARKNICPMIITASGVTALKSFLSLTDFYNKENCNIPIFISIGNGNALYKFDKNGKKEIYNKRLKIEEVKNILKIYEEVYLNIKEEELQTKGIDNFKSFINNDWNGYIPNDYVELFKKYNGRCFCEEIKVTFVFPKWNEKEQRELAKEFQKKLDDRLGKGKYLASRGDDVYLHITHTFEIDPKLFALHKVINYLGLAKENVVTFGDLPFDNDNGILIKSELPYTFTNSFFDKKIIDKPPYILKGSEKFSVGSVHLAIEYLIS